MGDFVTIARIVKARGVKGEVAAEVLTDFPDRFCRVSRLRLLSTDRVVWTELERFRFQGKRIILKFQGFDSPEEARRLAGSEVQIPEDEAVDLPAGVYFHFQLIGCRVVDQEKPLGRVVEVLETGGGANLVVRTGEGTDFMIPLAERFIDRVDLEAELLRVTLPEGLLELAEASPKSREPDQSGPP